MRLRRGQAFETMMLVISVIVAVAILGILLGFLGGIGGFGQTAKTVIPDALKKVASTGHGIEVRDNVEFNAGDYVDRTMAIGEAPVSEDMVKFACDDQADALCGTDETKPIVLGNNDGSVTATKKISTSVAVCTNDATEYWVVIGNKGKTGVQKASAAARDKCSMS